MEWIHTPSEGAGAVVAAALVPVPLAVAVLPVPQLVTAANVYMTAVLAVTTTQMIAFMLVRCRVSAYGWCIEQVLQQCCQPLLQLLQILSKLDKMPIRCVLCL